MKTILAAILATLSLGIAQAVEYVTLTRTTRTKAINPTSLVEVVGFGQVMSRDTASLNMSFSDGSGQGMTLQGSGTEYNEAFNKIQGNIFTGVVSMSLQGNSAPVVTLKITPASEINPVAPSTVLVLPENSTGNFDVVIEASDDLVSWLPFFSQTVNSQTANKFFRTRVVRSEAPVQKP